MAEKITGNKPADSAVSAACYARDYESRSGATKTARKRMRTAVLIAFIILWFLNFAVLGKVYDTTVYAEYISFWRTRGILYDGMFFSISLILFLSWKGIEKALACFMVIITAGSFIDKAIFKITDFLYGDIVLIILGIIVSVVVYGRTRKRD